MTGSSPILEARSVSKSFGGVNALKDVSLSIGKGEIVAVIGENGAGKSTLLKILCGVYQADSGEVHCRGRVQSFLGIHDAMKQGIARIPQELELCESMTVAENLLLGREPKNSWGVIQEECSREMAQRALDRLKLDFPLDQKVSSLGHGRRQLLSIVRSLDTEAELLLLDEPTATLSPGETEVLLKTLQELRDSGGSLVLITHRLAEVEAVADRVVVLRDGDHVGTLKGEEIERSAMVRLMVGRDLEPISQPERNFGEAALILDKVTTDQHPNPISLQVHQGECVALAGLVGSGRSELLEAIFGLRKRQGKIHVGEALLPENHPVAAVDAGLCLVPEERSEQGLSLDQTVMENAALPGLHRLAGFAGVLQKGVAEKVADRVVDQFNVHPPAIGIPARGLSGGNQQKVVIGKWMDLDPGVLILDEPTRGVDVGAREEIHQRLRNCTATGKAILFASSELEEIFAISDRIVVMAEGRIMGSLPTSEASEEWIMELATKVGI
ncbi:hypothetical protein CBD41_06975 [bacterium TMED181]|nr:D-xylose ABC transporter ATP-binding protein [Planctomycetota bacterium]OUW43568.1 MAG: hypothetical protein CBD41_06975 [bacterium TMED181]